MSKIVMFEGYRKRPKHRRRKLGGHKRRHHRKHLGKHKRRRRHLGSAHKTLFGRAAKSCAVKLRGKWSRSAMSACMKKALRK